MCNVNQGKYYMEDDAGSVVVGSKYLQGQEQRNIYNMYRLSRRIRCHGGRSMDSAEEDRHALYIFNWRKALPNMTEQLASHRHLDHPEFSEFNF